MTPIQLANMMATVANEGHYYTSSSKKSKAQASIKNSLKTRDLHR
jgi:cell division protein FtsI/penicillin-binding protein 2